MLDLFETSLPTGSQGKARRPREEDPVMRAMNYLAAAYRKLPAPERQDFIQFLKSLLHEMEKGLESKGEATNPGGW